MLERIPLRLFVEWLEYAKISPFGLERQDLHAAMVCSTLANCFSSKKRYSPSDFMPKWGEKAGKTPKQMWEVLKTMAKAQNEYVRKHGKSSS